MRLAPQTFKVKLGSHWSEDGGFVEGDDLSLDAALKVRKDDDEDMA